MINNKNNTIMKKLDDNILKENLINTLSCLKISKEKSALIIGGATENPPGGVSSRSAWICFTAACNPGCNTACIACVAASCTTNYG